MTAAPDLPAAALAAGAAPQPVGALTPADVAVPARVALDQDDGRLVVTVLGAATRHTASLLSCRLHEALAVARPGTELVVDLGAASAADPAIERVLLCARESAADRGIGFALQ
jgi:hypothetical protein